jgi:hypothetical protein
MRLKIRSKDSRISINIVQKHYFQLTLRYHYCKKKISNGYFYHLITVYGLLLNGVTKTMAD